MSRGVILANFGGPRNLEEVPSFLVELLTDVDVIRTPFPRFFEKWFFERVAKKRAHTVSHDYLKIGGKSPIFEDTENWASYLRQQTGLPVITFHRYLKATHADFIRQMEDINCQEMIAFPLYPQFSFATTGSIARFFQSQLSEKTARTIQWVRSYPTHPDYILAMQNSIADFLKEKKLKQEEVVLFFSAHGIPRKFVKQGDPYAEECEASYEAIRTAFPSALTLLAFQSKFGRGEWLKPYTIDLCTDPLKWNQGRQHVVFVPLSFTSDHIETLFEIESQYLPLLRASGLSAYRCPALNQREDWLKAMVAILNEIPLVSTPSLVRS